MGIQRVTRGYRRLKEVTRGHSRLQGVTGGYKAFQGLTGGYKGIQGVQRIIETFSKYNVPRYFFLLCFA